MPRPRVRRELEWAFWRGIRAGLLIEQAAVAVGVSATTGRGWFVQAGGVMPADRGASVVGDAPRKSHRLCFAEREEIFALRGEGRSPDQIADAVGRHRSTIYRELARNTGFGRGYRPSRAQEHADQRARRPKPSKLAGNDRLCEHVQARLTAQDSPEQIVGRLPLEFPDEPEMRVSHETIYRALYVQGRGALKRELSKQLRTGRSVRKPRRRDGERRGRIPDQVNIAERPAEADDRAVPGHWEGDLITGKDNGSAIGTLVERATGFVLLLHLPDRHGALEVEQAVIPAMVALPDTLRRTLAWDQGSEMANHIRIADATGLQIFFCDPHSPWQRAINENTNGLLRQYFPKGTDLSGYHPDYLAFVAARLNNRPRKRLDFRTPAEALDQLLSNPTDPPDVALTA
jgi:IS30 family transposase